MARVVHLDYPTATGVERKLRQQSDVAARAGLSLEFALLTDSREGGSRWSPRSLASSNLANLRQIREALRRCDMVVLRFPKVPFGFVLAIARHGRSIVTEHHTDEIGELRATRSAKRALLVMAVRLVTPFLLRRVAGIIGVTDEVRRVEVAKAGNRKTPSITVTNGIDVDATRFTRFVPFDGRTLRLVFVASHFQPWHGCDRLLEGLARYPGPVRVDLALVGRVDRDLAQMAEGVNAHGRHAVRAVGPAHGAELDRHMSEATLAIGSLAIHRNGMREACTLKVREYAARGIPFVYAYDDRDIPAEGGFALKLKGNDAPIDMEQVVSFARQVSGLALLSERMREFAKAHLDWACRVRATHEFASSLYVPG